MDNLDRLIYNTTFTVNEVDFATVGSFWKNIVSFYKYYRIYLVTKGNAKLFLKGKMINLEAGYLYFIPSYSVVSGDCLAVLGHYYLHFQAEGTLDNILGSLDFHHKIKVNAFDEQIFINMMETIKVNPPTLSSLFNLHGSLQLFLSRFLADAKIVHYDISRFDKIFDYIDKNITKKITVKKLASLANLNETYFSNLFKKTIGISPLQYVINRKINYSMTLLFNNNYRIKDVAYHLGFKDEYYFSRIFKQKTGMSPSDFMNSKKQNI